jgi:hypothetical protein
MATLRDDRSWSLGLLLATVASAAILTVAYFSPVAIALAVAASIVCFVLVPGLWRRTPARGMWDLSMLSPGENVPWYANLWLWWCGCTAVFVAIYVYFW